MYARINSKIKSQVANLTRPLILRANYRLNNYREVIWLIGDGRSGTTWVSDLINHDKRYREMFEPFHPRLVNKMKFLAPHQYIRENDQNEKLRHIASDIFSGKFTHRRVDLENQSLTYKGLLIKDIFANLLSYWASLNFPHIKPVLLIRNPFSVALSKQKKKTWFWATEPLALLNQTALYEDFLRPFEDTIRRTSQKNDYILNLVLIWSIINYVPLRQFKPGTIHICFYEDLFTNTNEEISRIFPFTGGSPKEELQLDTSLLSRPSRVSGKESNVLSGTSPVSYWKNELPAHLIDEGLQILQEFGFDELYDGNSMPRKEILERIQMV